MLRIFDRYLLKEVIYRLAGRDHSFVFDPYQ